MAAKYYLVWHSQYVYPVDLDGPFASEQHALSHYEYLLNLDPETALAPGESLWDRFCEDDDVTIGRAPS